MYCLDESDLWLGVFVFVSLNTYFQLKILDGFVSK